MAFRYRVLTVYDRAAGLINSIPVKTKDRAFHAARLMHDHAPEWEYIVEDVQAGKIIKRYTPSGKYDGENPGVFVVGANPGGRLMGVVHSVKYKHQTEGNRVHNFGAGVLVEAMPDGSMRIYHPDRPVWEDIP